MMSSNLDPLQVSGFQRMHEALYYYEPLGNAAESNASDPETILFLAWGNAPPKNIVKYTAHYQSIFPRARILVFLTTFSDLVLHTQERQAEPLAPAVELIRSTTTSTSKTLVHILSNGGSYKLRELCAAYRRSTGHILPINALIIDSAPGRPDFKRSIVAFQTQLPKQLVLFWLGSLLVYLYMISAFVMGRVFARPPVTMHVWNDLNNPKIVDQRAKRLYVYSKEDALIGWNDVEAHAADATRQGYRIELEQFTGSKHVAHLVKDKDRYWSAVKRLWDSTSI